MLYMCIYVSTDIYKIFICVCRGSHVESSLLAALADVSAWGRDLADRFSRRSSLYWAWLYS